MTHLTLTGPHAGYPICRFNHQGERSVSEWKAERIAAGDSFSHAAYANLEHPNTCPECLAVWNDAATETEESR